MASQYVLRVADCTNFCYDRMLTAGEAIVAYDMVVSSGFIDCRFVAFGFEHLLAGYDDNHWVLVVSGDQVLTVQLGQFCDRPDNIRGYLVIADCPYYEEVFDLFLGKGCGNPRPNFIYVDQYLCGADGRPIRPGLVFKNYFENGDDVYVEPGKTYKWAWDVERTPGDFTLDGILAIKYRSDVPHKLRDGTVQGVAACVTPVNDTTQLVKFIHAFVVCPCGKGSFTVGSWRGYTTMCCGVVIKQPVCVKFSGLAGSIFALPLGSRSVGSSKFYAGCYFEYCCDFSGVEVWCSTRTFSFEGFCSAGAKLCSEDVALLYPTGCNVGNDGFALDYDLCYSIVSNFANESLVQRILDGTLNVSVKLFANVMEIFSSVKLWFVELCTPVFKSAMDWLLTTFKNFTCSTLDVKNFWDHLSMAKFYVEQYVLRFSITTSLKFKSIVSRFLDVLRVTFESLCIDFKNFSFKCKEVVGTNFLVFRNQLLFWEECAISGVREACLNTANYFGSVMAVLRPVVITRTEKCDGVVLEEIAGPIEVPAKGICKIINDFAFYYSGGLYFPLTSGNCVVEGTVFKAAGGSSDEDHAVVKPSPVKLDFEFDDDRVSAFLIRSLGVESKGFHNFDDFEEYIQSKVSELRDVILDAGFDFEIPECFVYSSEGTYEMCPVMMVSQFACEPESGDSMPEPCVEDDDSYEEFIGGDVLYLGPSEFWKNHWSLDCKPMVFKDMSFGKIWYPDFNGWNDAIRSLAVFVGQMFRMAGDDLSWNDNQLSQLWNTKSQYLWYKLAVLAYPDGIEKSGLDDLFKVTLSKLSLRNAAACWVCQCGASVELEGMQACCGHFSEVRCLCGKQMLSTKLKVPFEIVAPGYFNSSVVDDLARGCVVAVVSTSGKFCTYFGFKSEFLDCSFVDSNMNVVAVLKRAYSVDKCDTVLFQNVKYDVSIKSAIVDFSKISGSYAIAIVFNAYDNVVDYNLLRAVGVDCNLDVDFKAAYFKFTCGFTLFYFVKSFANLFSRDVLIGIFNDIAMGSEVLLVNYKNDALSLCKACSIRNLLYVLEADVYNVVSQYVNNVDFHVTPVFDNGGFKHLRLQDNNCWANAVFVGLQLCNYYTEENMQWQCALRGANSRFLKHLYTVNKTVYGFMADAAQALENLLMGGTSLSVKLLQSCFCGEVVTELKASVLKFRPVNGYFKYGKCSVCNSTVQAIILHMQGKGFFCYSAVKDNKLLYPGCVGELLYTGPDIGGHYIVKYNGCYFDGTGKVGGNVQGNAKSQVAIYVADGLPEPLCVKNGIRFFKASLDSMLSFKPKCVVNAANVNLAHGGGIAKAIDVVTKGELQRLSNNCKNKPRVGECLALKCSAFTVLNAVGPKNTDSDVEGLLANAYNSVRHKSSGIVITPLLSVGIFKVPLEISLCKFLQVLDGFSNFYCFVYTDGEVAALKNYFETSVTFGASTAQLNESVVAVGAVEDSVKSLTFGDVDVSVSLDDSVTVYVTDDSVNFKSVNVSTNATFGDQLGACAIDTEVVTDLKPCVTDEGKAVSVAPSIDYLAYYGFDAANFCAVSHADYDFEFECDDGVIALKQDRNNCWLNVVCLALQSLKPRFKYDGINKLWDDFALGSVGGFCHFVYHVSNTGLGCKNDAEVVLLKLSEFICTDTRITNMVCTQCVDCKDSVEIIQGAIVRSPLIKNSMTMGACEHGYCRNVIVNAVSGDCILAGVKPCVARGLITNVGRILFNGDVDNGHYTFFDVERSRLYDGSCFKIVAPSDVKCMVSSLVVRRFNSDTTKPKPQACAQEVKVSQDTNYYKVFENFSVKFFKYGDYVFNCVLILWFLMLDVVKNVFNCIKKNDIKILARIPRRTGLVFSRSVLYNFIAASASFYARRYWFYLSGICFNIAYVFYSLFFSVLRFSSICDFWVDGYYNSTFIKNDYCNGSLICHECLRGYEELSDFPHTQVKWNFVYNFNEFVLFYHFVVFTIMWCFGNRYIKFCLGYFALQLWSNALCWLDGSDNLWFLNIVRFDSISAHCFSLFCAVKFFTFVKHVFVGCQSPSCVACSRSAKFDRIACETIVNGVKRAFYVKANGGRKFCEKHQFFCSNCDSYGVGCTFINDHVAKEVANVTRTAVRATGPAFIDIDKVVFEDGFYYLYAGDQFWKYDMDVTSKKFDADVCIKDLSLSSDFIVFNDVGTSRANVINACVYFSQLVCKPIKIVNKALLSTLTIDYNGSMHEAYCKVLNNSFNKDFTKCGDLAGCKQIAGVDCKDSVFETGVKLAHRYDVLLCNDSANNFVTTYAKAGHRVCATDMAIFNRESVREINHAVLLKNKATIVWNVNVFSKLTSDTQDYVVKTTKAKGVLFLLTFNDHVNTQNLPCSMVNAKNGGFPLRHMSLYKMCLYSTLCAFIVFSFVFCCSYNFKTGGFESAPDYDYRYIENGAMKFFVKGLDCVYNVYDDFSDWHRQRFGFVPSFSSKCPIVIGANDLNVNVVPNVPANVALVGRVLVFTYQTIFGHSKLCFNDAYNVNMAKVSAADCERASIFPSACTTLSGVGGKHVYCFSEGLYAGAKLYSDIIPHLKYYSDASNYVMLPEVILRGFGFKITRYLADTYCRIGECASSNSGVCVGADEWYVYDKEVGDNYFCGKDVRHLFLSFISIFNSNIGTVLMTGQLMFNIIVAFVIICLCYTFVKFKRIFGDMSSLVLMVFAATFVNSLSYLFTVNLLFLLFYTFVYFVSTRKVYFPMVWDLMYVVSYSLVAPWYVVAMYVAVFLFDCLPSIFKLKISTNLLEGDKFVGSFEHASRGTFVLNAHSCAKLVNEVGQEKLDRYAANYARYRHYSGNPNEADYRAACFAWLAKAIKDYQLNPQDKLYCAPTVSYNSVLQSGFRKIAQPSGLVEPCIVKVCYLNSYLNGVWLGDQVYAPRHVIVSDTTRVIDYETEQNLVRSHNFSVSKGSVFLTVKGFKFEGCNVVLNVAEVNPFTPEHTFDIVKPGESFNILACYDGCPGGVYGVTLRHNNTIRGSFINGTCGSPGYVITNGVIKFCYLHQMELGSGAHVGSDFSGKMYGGYQDQAKIQIEGVNKYITENVIAFFYAALLNGERWWCTNDNVCVTNFNSWAADNHFTMLHVTDIFNLVASKTGVSVEQILAAIITYAKGFGHRTLLGYASINDEYTITEVMQQMFGVQLQSKKRKVFEGFALFFFFVALFWTQFLMYTSISILQWEVIIGVLFSLTFLSATAMIFVKHKMVFLYGFVIPATMVVVFNNFLWDYVVSAIVVEHASFMSAYFSFDMQNVFNICMLCFVLFLHLMRCYCSGGALFTCVLSCAYTIGLFVYFVHVDVLSAFFMFISGIQRSWAVTWVSYKLAVLCVTYVSEYYINVFGYTKVLMVLYLGIGYAFCVYYGVLFWVNKFTMSNFSMCIGYYDYCVSQSEFKYMVANNLKCPTNPLEALYLNMKLMGIGGPKVIKLATIQSKLTDLKCTNVVLLSCLSSMNVAVNSKEWSYCVQLHNDINLCDDPEKATEKLLALCAFFLSKQQNFNLDVLIDSYFDNKAILHSVASTFASMPSYIAYEKAKIDYEQAKQNGSSDQVIRQLLKAMNIAKSEFDLEVSVQRKLSRMADNAAAQMFKEARNVDRKAKVVSSMHGLLVSMLRRLDMSSINELMDLAKDGILPLAVIPAASASRLVVVTPSIEAFDKIRHDNSICYAGAAWSIISIKDVDGTPVQLAEVCADNDKLLNWPLHIEAERVVKLQNNEITPGKLMQRTVTTDVGCSGKALYCNEQGRGFIYALLADSADIKYLKWDNGTGEDVHIELEKPVRFAISTPNNGTQVKYLYFVKNLNTLRRGAVLGFIGATVRLQAGKPTEYASDCQLLTLCAFAVDPKDAYLTAVRQGHKPLGNCIKMINNGSGNGLAITPRVEANTVQDSYGGASCCIYCRASVEHPGMNGICNLKGKYVQVPTGTQDPVRFCLENEVCSVCSCWLGNGCVCDRSTVQSTIISQDYLNGCGALVQLN
ncbi:ORF1a [plateatu pika coronavirus P83]|nr:ORF1a [plateatu pika coronavirus P83]